MFTSVCHTLIAGLDDYTVDSRGDIGAIVRESAMSSIQVYLDLSIHVLYLFKSNQYSVVFCVFRQF